MGKEMIVTPADVWKGIPVVDSLGVRPFLRTSDAVSRIVLSDLGGMFNELNHPPIVNGALGFRILNSSEGFDAVLGKSKRFASMFSGLGLKTLMADTDLIVSAEGFDEVQSWLINHGYKRVGYSRVGDIDQGTELRSDRVASEEYAHFVHEQRGREVDLTYNMGYIRPDGLHKSVISLEGSKKIGVVPVEVQGVGVVGVISLEAMMRKNEARLRGYHISAMMNATLNGKRLNVGEHDRINLEITRLENRIIALGLLMSALHGEEQR